MATAQRNVVLPVYWPDEVVIGVEAMTRRHAIEMAASLLATQHGLREPMVFRALWRREEAGSTGLGHGIAIPHARVPGIDRPVTLLLRLTKTIDFGGPDHQAVDTIFAFLVPEHGARQQHLDMLASIAKMFSETTFCDRLHSLTRPAEVRKLFAECGAVAFVDSGNSARPNPEILPV